MRKQKKIDRLFQLTYWLIVKSKVKVYSSRRQDSHLQRRRVTGAGAGARGCGPHHPPVSRKSPARDEPSFGCVVQTTRQFFVRFLFEVCWLLSFFSPEVPVQGELVRARVRATTRGVIVIAV